MKPHVIVPLACALAAGVALAQAPATPPAAPAPAAPAAQAPAAPDILPLPEQKIDAKQAELGKFLFFDKRLSGDAALSCATCHDPKKGWGEDAALGKGYPASENFRNTPTILNATLKSRYHWDGRLDGSDPGTLVRDQITEAVFMNADGRLVQERVKQVPEYVELWKTFRKDDPNGMRIFNIVGEFIKTVTSKNVPYDKFKAGDAAAISDDAKTGYELFKGKAGCVVCHNGPVGSDGKLHKTGVPENPQVLSDPEHGPLRAITMLRHYSTSGMPNYMNARTDVGFYAITKAQKDMGKFNTPSIRDLKYTAPYMHNGMLKTLDEVVEFYSKGGGKGSELKPLGLSAAEKKSLVAFLESLSGDPVVIDPPKIPDYRVREFGKN